MTNKLNCNICSLLAVAYSLGANFGWFIGLVVSVLVIIGLSVLIVLLYKRRTEPEQKPYTGIYKTLGSHVEINVFVCFPVS